jgi:hypothetical protein
MPRLVVLAGIVALAVPISAAALASVLLSSASPGRASPQEYGMHVHGVIQPGAICVSCSFLQTDSGRYELLGDLEGCSCGDTVDVWARPFQGSSTCMEGTTVIVENVIGPCTDQPDPAVGGIAQLPDVAGDSVSSAGTYAALAGGLVASALALLIGARYAQRRWARRRS